jgi:hypothetical protein
MATIAPVVQRINESNDRVTWTGLTQATLDDGAPVRGTDYADRTVQVFGTFGAGGSVLIEGTLEEIPVNWAPLTDPQGNNLAVTTSKLEAVVEYSGYIRPRVTAGDGATSLTVLLLLRKQR